MLRDPSQKSVGLLALGKDRFPDLTNDEKTMLSQVVTPDRVIYGPGPPIENGEWELGWTSKTAYDPKSSEWKDREVRAKVIRWLCVDREAIRLVDPRGIQLWFARITGNLDLSYVDVPFPIALSWCRVEGVLHFDSCQIPALSMQGCWAALGVTANSATVKRDVFFGHGFKAERSVELYGAQIGGSVDFQGSSVSDRSGDVDSSVEPVAILADEVNIGGKMLLCASQPDPWLRTPAAPFTANGAIRLRGARVGGDVSCSGGCFINEGHNAIVLELAAVKGGIFFTPSGDLKIPKRFFPFQAHGHIDLRGCTVNTFQDGNPFVEGKAVNHDQDVKSKEVEWKPFEFEDNDKSERCEAGRKVPPKHSLFLEGFAYDRILPSEPKLRLPWLCQNAFGSTEPYERLARSLENSGDTAGAKRVRIEMEDGISRKDLLPVRLCKRFVAYGYHNENAAFGLAVVTALGFAVVSWRCGRINKKNEGKKDHEKERVMVCSGEEAKVQRFSPLFYSLENTFPLVKLGQADKWTPNPWPPVPDPGRDFWKWMKLSGFLQVFVWVQILLGWFLATLFVAGLLGVFRH